VKNSVAISSLVGRKVFPGEPLCTIEEYLPGDGVYVDDGLIRAARFGQVEIDPVSRRISVKSVTGKPRLPRRGVSVYGVAIGAPREELMLIRIFADERMIAYNGSFTGILHVSQVSEQYGQGRSIYDFVKPGDVVEIKESSRDSKVFEGLSSKSADNLPNWISVDYANFNTQ